MKTFITAVIIAAAASTAAYAEDWKNTTMEINMVSGPLDFSIEANQDNFTDLEFGYTFYEHTYGGVDADIRFALGTNARNADNLTFLGQYNMSTVVGNNFELYGTAEIAYVSSADLDDESWMFRPETGVMFNVNDKVSVFGEVGYSWNMSDDFADEGGYVQIGMPFHATDSMTITPSIVQTFDVADESANFRLEASFNF